MTVMGRPRRLDGRFEINDETLRDGLQSPSARHPGLEVKRAILRQLAALNVDAVSLGLPAAGRAHYRAVEGLLRTVVEEALPIEPHCAVRTTPGDLAAVARLQQAAGASVVAYAFLGCSAVRRFAEGWSFDHLLSTLDDALAFADRERLEVAFVTEDTTRTSPEELERLLGHAVAQGVRRLVLCDTVGHATPRGATALVRFVRSRFPDVALDWHGHDDRGLAVANALAAARAGADRIHGTVLGLGERCGNTPLDRLLIARSDAGGEDRDRGARELERWVRAHVAPVEHSTRTEGVAASA